MQLTSCLWRKKLLQKRAGWVTIAGNQDLKKKKSEREVLTSRLDSVLDVHRIPHPLRRLVYTPWNVHLCGFRALLRHSGEKKGAKSPRGILESVGEFINSICRARSFKADACWWYVPDGIILHVDVYRQSKNLLVKREMCYCHKKKILPVSSLGWHGLTISPFVPCFLPVKCYYTAVFVLAHPAKAFCLTICLSGHLFTFFPKRQVLITIERIRTSTWITIQESLSFLVSEKIYTICFHAKPQRHPSTISKVPLIAFIHCQWEHYLITELYY